MAVDNIELHAPYAPEAPHGEHHIASLGELFGVYFILLGLMVLTVAASYWHLGALNNVVAMIIALIKATFVVLCFMQVRKASRLVWLWAAIGFIWFLLMFGIVGDYVSREWIPSPGWENPVVPN